MLINDSANNAVNTELNITGTLNNAGIVQLTSSGSSGDLVILDLTGGTFNNNSGGVLQVDVGAGGGRTLNNSFANAGGTVDINTDTTFQGGTLTNTGLVDVAGSTTLTVASGAILAQGTSGTYAATGTININDGATFRFDANGTITAGLTVIFGTTGGAGATWSNTSAAVATVSGTVDLNRGTVGTAFSIASGGVVQVDESNDFVTITTGSAGILSGGLLLINDSANNAVNTELNITGTLNNAGTVQLTTSGSSTDTVTLDLPGGVFNNNTGGVLQIDAGTGGARTYNGNLNNAGGTVDINTDTTFQGGTLTNTGIVDVTTSQTLTIASGATLAQGTGGTYIGAGTILLGTGATFDVAQNGSLGGTLTLQMNGSTAAISGANTLTIASGALLDADDGTVSSGLTVASGGAVNVYNTNNLVTFSGAVTNQGDFFIHDFTNDAVNTEVNITGTLTTTGLIQLDTGVSSTGTVILDASSGTINVSSGGELEINAGTGGARTVNGEINNSGTVDVNASTTFNIGSVDLENMSGGLFDIESGDTVTMQGTGIFHNQASSTLNVAGTLDMNGQDLTNDGTISGAGTITMGGGTYTNNGSSSITPGASPGTLTIDGNAVLGSKTKTFIELGGRGANDNDMFAVTGRFAAGGTLAILPWLSFAAAAGDSFDILSWGERSSIFHEISGLDQFAGVALDPIFTDTGLTLEARAITAEGGEGDDDIEGTSGDDALVGFDGADLLIGGAGSDLLLGGEGNDVLIGGEGADRLVGGHGHDTADFSSGNAPVQVDLTLGTALDGAGEVDTLVSIEELIGTVFSDTLIGNDADNIIVGGGGADLMIGGEGRDTFVVGGPDEAGDTISDFTSGEDVLELDGAAFGLEFGETALGENFSIIIGAYDGTDAGDNAAFASGDAALIYSQADATLYFDGNGAQEGYTTVANLQPGAILTASDVRITENSFA